MFRVGADLVHDRLSLARMKVIIERHELIAFYERRGYVKRGEPEPVLKLSCCEELKEKIHFVLLEKNLKQ